jgi:branched-chain amino acid transport system substrate-binding protein
MRTSKAQIMALSMLLVLSAFVGCLGDDEEPEPEPEPEAVLGCTDSTAENYNGNATEDDGSCTFAATTTTVKIGLLSPITGPIAVYAPGFSDAANVAIAELNAANAAYVFELVVGDSGCDGTTAASAAQTLVDAGVAGIAGAACSGATLGAIEVAKAASTPMVSYASTSPAITAHADDGYLFRVVPSDAQQGQAMAAVAAAESFSNVALIYMTNDYGAGLADAFEGSWLGDNESFCVKVGYDADVTDFSTIVQQVADGGCGSVVSVTYATDGAGIVEELAAQGVDVPFLGADGIADLAFVGEFSDASAVAGIMATKPSPGSDSSEKTAFEAAYTAAGGDAGGIYTAETYDAVNIIAAAAMADSDGDLRDDLATIGTNYAGASGVHTFMASGDVVGSGYQVCFFWSSTNLDCGKSWNLADGLGGGWSDTRTTIKIGLLSPITGPIAVYAPGFSDAAYVAISELNANNPDYNFELVVGDSGCDGTTAASAAQTLVDAGVAGIAGAACSGATLGAIEVAKAASTPMVSYASTSPAITAHGDDNYLFRVVPSDAQQGQALAAVASNEMFENVALIYMTNDYGAGLADAFEASWGEDLCVKHGYDQDTTDYTSIVDQIVNNNCDSVVSVTYATDGAGILEEMAVQGVEVAFLGADGIADMGFEAEFSDNSTLGGVRATKPSPGGDSAEKTAFEAAYAAAGGDPGGIYTAETYDAVMIIGLAAMADNNSDLRDDLATVGTNYAGASGTHTFMASGDVVGSGYLVCAFSYDGSAVSFSCDQTWNLADGLQG